MPATHQPHYDCDLCRQSIQMGAGVYDGRTIPQWGKMTICKTCEVQNEGGIMPASHQDFMERLAERGVIVNLNDDGYLDIPPRGSRS